MPRIYEQVKPFLKKKKIAFSNKEVLSLTAHQHSVVILIKNLKGLCRKQRLFRSMKQTRLGEAAAFVQAKIRGNGQLKGIHGYTCVQFRGGHVSITGHNKTSFQVV